MNLGGLLVAAALVTAFAAAAVRRRDWFYALLAVGLVIGATRRLDTFGIDPTRLVGNLDNVAVLLGGTVLAAAVFIRLGLPRRVEERLLLGDLVEDWRFDRALVAARQPFLDAGRAVDDSVVQRARWRHLLTQTPPNASWAALADEAARGDIEWADGWRSGAAPVDWTPWTARSDQLGSEWARLRAPLTARWSARMSIVRRLSNGGMAVAFAFVLAGTFNVPTWLTTGPPSGPADVIPRQPSGGHVYLAAIGEIPGTDLQRLADFYLSRYDLVVEVLAPTTVIPPNPARGQLNGDGLFTVLAIDYLEYAGENSLIIGVVGADMYTPLRPEWRFAFGQWGDGLAVVSTARMQTQIDVLGERLEEQRLRKFITRYIGLAYFGLPASTDPSSVLYENVLSVFDLDDMGEDY